MDRGYRLRDFRFIDALDLTVWSGCQMSLTVRLSSSSLVSLKEHRWIGGHRAVYFSARIREQQDSLVIEEDAEILYDFNTATFYMTSPLFLWRSPTANHEQWLSKAEFRSALKSLEQGDIVPRSEDSSLQR
jgi:hypothetical protein